MNGENRVTLKVIRPEAACSPVVYAPIPRLRAFYGILRTITLHAFLMLDAFCESDKCRELKKRIGCCIEFHDQFIGRLQFKRIVHMSVA